jgi:hypothetical protein
VLFLFGNLQQLCIPSFSASGWQEIPIKTYSSQILECCLSVPSKEEAQSVDYQYLYGEPAIDSLGSRPAVTVCGKCCRETWCIETLTVIIF